MTESEWLAAVESEPMIRFLRSREAEGGNWDALHYSITCCKFSWDHLEPQERSIAEMLIRFAASPAKSTHNPFIDSLRAFLTDAGMFPSRQFLSLWKLNSWIIAFPFTAMTRRHELTASLQSEILRDIVGNPFREVTFDPEWRSAAVVALTESIAKGDHSHYPILADALLDAGCRDETVLDHCRQSGRHFKHCWVIEGLLKSYADAVGNG